MQEEKRWGLYIIADLKTWATNARERSPFESYETFEETKARFIGLRMQEYNNQKDDLAPDGEPYAHLTLGIRRLDGTSSVDILHVRQGMNYLVDDFTRIENIYTDQEAMGLFNRMAAEIGFDRVRRFVKTNSGYYRLPDVSIHDWESAFRPKLLMKSGSYNSFKVSATVDIVLSQQEIDDIMATALEGGITYWCCKVAVVGDYLGEYASEQISRGGTLKLYDRESDAIHKLNLYKFLTGFRLYVEGCSGITRDLRDHLDMDSIDALAADMIVQYALFNELVYG